MKNEITIKEFNIRPEQVLAGKYRVATKLGKGWEGEVYKVVEIGTGIERAAKLFYPQRNERKHTSRSYARKLHKLRQCSILIQYHTEETILYRNTPVTVLVSEYVEGELLSKFLTRFSGKRMSPYQALHLLYALVRGIEEIHLLNEYHGDIHTDNIIVNHFGLEFELKLVDHYRWSGSKAENRQDDIINLVHVLHECLGGAKYYAKQPDAIKYICSGLKRSLILRKFRNASQLREHVELMEWK